MEKLLQWLSSTLDNRVFVALTRGLWDLTAKDVLAYAEDLHEGTHGHGQQVGPGVGGAMWGSGWFAAGVSCQMC